jgi:hypothetical protein
VDASLLAKPVEKPAGHPKMIPDLKRPERTHLEFPLSGHDLRVDTGNLDPCPNASLKMFFYEIPTKDLVCPDAAIIRPLGCRKPSIFAKAKGARSFEEGVFLLQTKKAIPGAPARLLNHFFQDSPHVGFMRRTISVQDFTKNKSRVSSNRVLERPDGI